MKGIKLGSLVNYFNDYAGRTNIPILYIEPNLIPISDKLRKLTKDPLFKENVEFNFSDDSLYISAERGNKNAIETLIKLKKEFVNLEKELKPLKEYVDNQYPGLFEKLIKDDPVAIVQLLKTFNNDEHGSNASVRFNRDNMCLSVNKSTGINSNNNYYFSNLLALGFSYQHLTSYNISHDIDLKFTQLHENEHCTQKNLLKKENIITIETFADAAALKIINDDEITQKIIDIRVIYLALGDNEHATSIFLEHPALFEQYDDKDAIFSAAANFKEDINSAVGNELKISSSDAKQLFKDNPRKFINALKASIDKEEFPASTAIRDDNEIRSILCKKLGLKNNVDLEQLAVDDIDKVKIAYNQAKKEGLFIKSIEQNPYTFVYAQQFLQAADRIFVADTTPINKPKNANEILTSKPSLKKEAKFFAIEQADKTVSNYLKIELIDSEMLRDDNAKKYYKALDEAVKKGKVDTKIEISINEDGQNKIVSEYLGIDKKDFDYTEEKNPVLIELTKHHFNEKGAFTETHDNPYIIDEIKLLIDEHKKQNNLTSLGHNFNTQALGSAEETFAKQKQQLLQQQSTQINNALTV